MKPYKAVVFSIICLSASQFLGSRLLTASKADELPPPTYFTIPESELLGSEFSETRWGAAAEQTDAFDQTVLFTFTGLTPSSTGLKDDYPVAQTYGQILPSHAGGDFSNFAGCVLWVKNLDAQPVSVSLFVNTGFTGPSGIPSNEPKNDTFWHSPWTEIQPDQARTLKLEFDSATPWNIADNPAPHTQGSDGVTMPINDYDRAEISAIGFQIYANGNPKAPILIAPAQAPICSIDIEADFDKDCKVTFKDLAILANQWLNCTKDPPTDC
jgi:hypothetical protein